jgi:hypothetical protein
MGTTMNHCGTRIIKWLGHSNVYAQDHPIDISTACDTFAKEKTLRKKMDEI